MNILFVSAHPDDIELGCIGALLIHKEKRNLIHLRVMSECLDIPRNKNMAQDFKNALRLIPYDTFDCPCLPNRKLDHPKIRMKIRETLEQFRDFHDVDIVYTHWINDLHQDHRAVAEEAIRVFKFSTINQFEVLNSCPGFIPNKYVELSDQIVDKKLKALECYTSQKKMFYFKPNVLKAHMVFRGAEVRKEFAEAFRIWREI
jgi:LmbE family N-acetylglucosaminyl deacetylase